jgi:hypothetical protein
MPGAGRNEPCPCGSGRKVKRCCGQRRGPSDDQLARAHISVLARQVTPDVAGLSDLALRALWDELIELPATDLSLLVELPRLITPDMLRLQEAIADDDADLEETLCTVAAQVDTPRQRARLADALIRLRDQHRITDRQAAIAILDLDSRSDCFVTASVLEAVAVSAGAVRTPGGLQIAA